MPEKILQRGAEAMIILDGNKIIKRRIKKGYRLPQIDEEIRKLRTRSEGRLLEKASKFVNIPKIIKIDEKTKEIIMGFIEGKRLSDYLDFLSLDKQKKIFRKIGENVATLHDADIIHGDLTTSNMILTKSSNKKGDDEIFFIDFGLGFHSSKIEDKAVDLHLLKEALEAKHFQHWQALFDEFLNGYSISKHDSLVKKQLKKVEIRGRYKEKY